MTDLEVAKSGLAGHTICLCRGGSCIFSEKRGVAPVMGFIADGVDLNGYSVADKVVGKAAALLFVKCGITAVYAETLSESGKKVLDGRGIYCEYRTLTEKIINREGTGMCPMESAVRETEDAEQAYILIKNKLKHIVNGAD